MARNNIIAKLQRWMDSKPGQMFLNYAYSWGASIVILGALFKITHIKGADFMLFLGMGTEVIVFFLAGFERLYDDDGKEETTADTAGERAATRYRRRYRGSRRWSSMVAAPSFHWRWWQCTASYRRTGGNFRTFINSNRVYIA